MGSFSTVDIITMERETGDKTFYEQAVGNEEFLRASRPKPYRNGSLRYHRMSRGNRQLAYNRRFPPNTKLGYSIVIVIPLEEPIFSCKPWVRDSRRMITPFSFLSRNPPTPPPNAIPTSSLV